MKSPSIANDLPQPTSTLFPATTVPYKQTSDVCRKELSQFAIPPVKALPDAVVQICYQRPATLLNAKQLSIRPPKSVVEDCRKAVNTECRRRIEAGVADTAAEFYLEISGFGAFCRSDITVLEHYEQISDLRWELVADANWLRNDDTLSNCEQEAILAVLEGTPLTTTIARNAYNQVDTKSLATLTRENYVDNFVIDYLILKFISMKPKNSPTSTVYLPGDSWKWSKTENVAHFKKMVENHGCLPEEHKEILQVLVVVNLGENHWALLYVDLIKKKTYFDDSLKARAPATLSKDAYLLMVMLNTIRPILKNGEDLEWLHTSKFERFGMPVAAGSAVGAGSCGIGVILAAWYFVSNPCTAMLNVNWQFSDMGKWRKRLLNTILKWA